MNKEVIQTAAAPQAIGTYSQGIKIGNTVYVSGQIPLDPHNMELVTIGMEEQIVQVFENLRAVCEAAGGGLSDIVKLNLYLTDLADFGLVNAVMARYFSEPYPARAAVGVNELPKGAHVEADAVMVVG